jgi:hypothetical protein
MRLLEPLGNIFRGKKYLQQLEASFVTWSKSQNSFVVKLGTSSTT